ncbi:MAG: 4-hydroxy-tetrahydrodipicolinate synthase [Oscillospiraceae bacterium]|jgi:4-hydroxy-tetrahydrodipicolinate synthase|nr:4-hydroxy-tetrahydrodipicolinate synthase [Oscillospiraceae bacterium]
MKNTLFTGSGVAIVTPFMEGTEKVNYKKLEELLEYQISHGTDAIIICGTTGESPVLDHEEHSDVIKFAVDVANKRIPVIAGTGSNDTAYGVKLSNEAEKAGADGLLMVTPYYNKTSQAGLIEHFNFIADRVGIPIIVYNVPSRTGVDIKPETYQALAKHKNIVGIKEANGDISSVAKTMALCGNDIDMYSGNDDQILAIMAHGGAGVISVLANIVPQIAHDICAEFLAGNVQKARELQFRYLDLCNDLFIDVNPIPIKEAMCMMGIDVGPCRLPLTKMSDAAHAKLQATLQKHGLI